MLCCEDHFEKKTCLVLMYQVIVIIKKLFRKCYYLN